ncbi:MAG TPA: acetylornithine transaminase [Verrucomicrobiales bacterium]|nr:acetylornithine transaminase [Verrucomicrobiales bacterium]
MPVLFPFSMMTVLEPVADSWATGRDCTAPTYGRFPLSFVRGSGCRLWDSEGRSYLDFGSGVAVCSLGHCPPVLVEALREQAGTLIHCSNLYSNPWQSELARRLTAEAAGKPGRVFFCNSGAEANECLIKLARRFGQARPDAGGRARHVILTFERSFHGRTMAGISATGQSKVQEGFAPLLPGFRHLPYNDAGAVEAAITEDTAAVLMEVVQGEGGIHVADPGFLLAVQDSCRRHDLLLLMDEIQCGFGRAGAIRAWEAVLDRGEDFAPDGISWAKGLGGGFPLGAVWMSDRAWGPGGEAVSSLLGPGSHGTTYGGSPLACAAGLAVTGEMIRGGAVENARQQGAYMMGALRGRPAPLVKEARGLGMMIGVMLDTGAVRRVKGYPESGMSPAVFVVDRLNRSGLLTAPAGADVVRLMPPLILTREEAEEGLGILYSTLAELGSA